MKKPPEGGVDKKASSLDGLVVTKPVANMHGNTKKQPGREGETRMESARRANPNRPDPLPPRSDS
jgi:hypothetical protein